MLAVPHYCLSCLSYSNYVGSVMVIVISLSNYCVMGPSITIFSLDSYSRSYGKNRIISGSIMFLIIFCLSTNALWCSSSLSICITIPFIIGMIPLVGQLYSSVAGLGSSGPSGVILICNKTRCISEIVSQHFLVYILCI